MRLKPVLMLVAVLATTEIQADETPAMGRGMSADKLYQMGDVDSVDLQSGALAVTLPIGFSYPVSERLSYGFSLSHSSRGIWNYGPAQTGYNATLNPRANAGAGWSFHMGLLFAPLDPDNSTTAWTYVSPDGGEHAFFGVLHSGEEGLDGDTTNSVDYTRDGTYLRLTRFPSNLHEIEFSDGTIRQFEPVPGSSTQYRIKEIRDRFVVAGSPQNWVRFDYSVPLTWGITDSRGRAHTVKFVSLTFESTSKPMVDYVDLAAFSGTPARWNFSYGGPGGGSSTIFRDCNQNNGGPLSAPILASVTRPDGSTWSFITYNDDPGPLGFFCRQGQLSEVTNPIGGKLQYDYQSVSLPANLATCPDPDLSSRVPVTAIQRRTLVDPVVKNPAQPTATWTYLYEQFEPPAQQWCGDLNIDPLPPEELRVTVTTPLQDKTEYFFSVWPLFADSPRGFFRKDYGLPFTRLDPASGGRFLSSIEYECAAGGGGCVAKRSHYVSYEQDPGGIQANRRLQGQRTVYHDDGNVFADTAYSGFDGVGHYRQSTTSGSFATGNAQAELANFNPGRGTYPGSYTIMPVSERWILDTYNRIDTTGGATSDTSRRVFDFDVGTPTATGSLRSTRTYLGGGVNPSPGINDLFVLYCSDPMGNVASEIYYGGDGTRLQLPNPMPTCGSPSTWQYRIDHTYSGGVRSTSKYNGASNPFFLDRTINTATGLAASSRDLAEVETQYSFDSLGRLTLSNPQSLLGLPRDARTEYKFNLVNVGSGVPASVEVSRCEATESSCTAGNRLTYEKTELTGFGKEWHLLRSMPGTADKAVRVSRYNGLGLPTRVSSWVYDADGVFANENLVPATV
jgi:hypothetical protein